MSISRSGFGVSSGGLYATIAYEKRFSEQIIFGVGLDSSCQGGNR